MWGFCGKPPISHHSIWFVTGRRYGRIVSKRLGGGFPPDRSMGPPREDLPPADGSLAHARAVRSITADLESRAADLDTAVDALLDLVRGHDPVELLTFLRILTSMTTWSEGDRLDDGDQTYSWDAKTEYVAGLVLAGPPGGDDVGEDVVREAIQLTADVFDATQAELFLRSVGEEATENQTLDQISYLMQLEHLVDRMQGYVVHLEEINDAVFEPRRSLYLDALGFCPSDVVRVVRRHNRWVNAEGDRLLPMMAAAMRSGNQGEYAERVDEFNRSVQACNLWTPDLLVQTTGLPRDHLEAMLTLMSTEFNTQPRFRLPEDENVLRKKPFINTGDAFLVPTPWAPAHCIHDWLLIHLEEHPNPKLRERYFKGRSDGAERLVRASLADVFGESVVRANVHYDGPEGHGEIDCLIGGGTPVVVEVKSQSVTDPGRRGNRARLERVARDLLERSSDQTAKAAAYIVAGGRTFAQTEGAEPVALLHDDVAIPTQVVVSFEGIDPLAISIASLLESEAPLWVWVTDLADLLVVRDFLGEPGAFLDYAQARADPTRPLAYMESDAVVAYLEERLRPESPGSESDSDVPVLPYRSGLINDYYTKVELGFPAERLGLGLPEEIRLALKVTGLRDNTFLWWQVARAILRMTAADWGRWRHFRRRERANRTFIPPSQNVGIQLSSEVTEPGVFAGEPNLLLVPRAG